MTTTLWSAHDQRMTCCQANQILCVVKLGLHAAVMSGSDGGDVQTTAVIAALLSATGFAISTSLQHHAAGSIAAGKGVAHLIGRLLTKPVWLAGQCVAVVSFGLHAIALATGPLALVQPLVVSGIVLAVPARAALSRHRPSHREITAVMLAAAGLAMFLVASNPTHGSPAASQVPAVIVCAAGVLAAAACHWRAARTMDEAMRAAFLGATAGIMFGLVAGLVKLSVQVAGTGGPAAAATAWSTWALVVVGACGVVTNQRSYQAARLSASMPTLNVIDVLVALAFGVVAFGEVPRHTPVAIVAELLAFMCIGVGLRRLALAEEVLELPVTTTERNC